MGSAPKPRDFSARSISSAVKKQIATRPSVVYTGAIGILGLMAGGLLDIGLLGWAIGAGGIGTALVSFLGNYSFRREAIANEYLQALTSEMAARRNEYTNRLQQQLREVDSLEGQSQFRRLTEKFEILKKMLTDKLNPQELTYGRYMATAEQVFLGGLENLQDLVNTIRGMHSIDRDYIHKRMKKLQAEIPDEDTTKELAAMQSRLDLYDAQKKKARRYLSQNEEALTSMDKVVAAISDLRTEDTRAELDLETAMEQLQTLAERVHVYNDPR